MRLLRAQRVRVRHRSRTRGHGRGGFASQPPLRRRHRPVELRMRLTGLTVLAGASRLTVASAVSVLLQAAGQPMGWVAIASRRGSLLAVPDRVALSQERGHTLLRVVRERVVGHDQLAVLVGTVLGAIDLGVESALSRSNRVCA